MGDTTNDASSNTLQYQSPMSKVLFVKFANVAEPGVYPIVPRSSPWYLDAKRPHPVLNIVRKQLPLAPAFAITAHASQGQTLTRTIADLHCRFQKPQTLSLATWR